MNRQIHKLTNSQKLKIRNKKDKPRPDFDAYNKGFKWINLEEWRLRRGATNQQ